MNKFIVCATLTVVAVMNVSCMAVVPVRKCYNLPVCKQTPSECKMDKEKGLYQTKSRATCKMDGGHL